MLHNPQVAIVILNYNGKKYLEKFLPILLQSTYRPITFYVADNHSTDNSLEMLRDKFPIVRIIELPTNEGYARGYNIALRQINADIYVLLNQDVEVAPGWIEPIVRRFISNENVAVVQPKVLAHKNKSYFEYAGAAGGFIDRFGYAFCRGRIFDTIEPDNQQYNNPCEIFWASGACMFIRATLYHQLGGLDDNFFAHFEEIDLCWRLKNAGYSIEFCPDSVVYHVGGSSLSYGNPRKTYLNYRNNLQAMIKNYYSPLAALIIVCRMLLDGLSALRLLVSGHFTDVWAILMAHVYIYLNFKDILAQRRQIKNLLLTSSSHIPSFSQLTGTYQHLIVVDYFLLRRKKFSELRW